MGGMLNAAFDEKTEFFMLDDLDPQKLHNSARNLEIAAWKLANARDAAAPCCCCQQRDGAGRQPANLSFEREFGKMIGNLDLLSRLIADKGNRTIARVAQSVATAVFLPVVAAMKRYVILISGRGSNMESLLDAGLPGQCAAVISNKAEAAGMASAAARGVATRVIDHRGFASREEFDAALAAEIERHAPDLVLLAGFMRILDEGFVRRFEGRLLNIHPSLLPPFPASGPMPRRWPRACGCTAAACISSRRHWTAGRSSPRRRCRCWPATTRPAWAGACWPRNTCSTRASRAGSSKAA
jgi:hypothetical protein